MIAVAKGLLGGLETAVAAASKKDSVTAPPFADTFQQASTDQAGRASKASTQRAARADRTASGGKRASAASSPLATQAGTLKGVQVLKSAGKVSDPAVVSTEGGAESIGEEETSGVVGEYAAKEQVAAPVEGDVKIAKAEGGQLFPRPAVTTARETGEEPEIASNSPTAADVPHLVEPVSNDRPSELVQAASQGIDSGIPAPKTVVDQLQNNSAGNSGSLAGLPVVRQSVGIADGAPLSAKNFLPNRILSSQGDQKSLVVSPSLGTAESLEVVEGPVAQIAPQDTVTVSGRGLVPTLQVVTGDEDFAQEIAVAQGSESASATKAGALPAEHVEGVAAGRASGSPHLPAPAPITRSASGLTAANAVIHGVSDADKVQESRTEKASSASAVEAVVIAGQTAVSDQAVAVPTHAPVYQLNADEKTDAGIQGQAVESGASSVAVKSLTLATDRTQAPKSVTTTSVSDARGAKSASKRGEEESTKEAIVSQTGVAEAPVAAVVTEGVAPTTVVAPTLGEPARHQFASQPEAAPISVSSKTGPASTNVQVRTSSATSVASGSNPVAVGVSGGHADATLVTPRSAVDLKAAIVDAGPEDVAAKARDTETNGVISSEIAPAAVQAESVPVSVASTMPLSREALVTAATSMVKSGQREVSGATSAAGKERKPVATETKAPDAAMSSTGAPVVHAATAITSAKPLTGEHQGLTAGSGQAPAEQAASLGSAGVVPQPLMSAATNAAPVAAPHGASSTVSSDASGPAMNTASQTSMTLGDHALSPMGHTTLSATPTVLEVGVPGGTQGWLKIRAEIGEGGVVQASMSAATHAGQEALHRDLPAISAFLESEHVPVNLQVAHSVSTSGTEAASLVKDTGFNPGSSLGQSLNQNANSSGGSGQGDAGANTFAGSNSNGPSGGQQHEANGRTPDSGSSTVPTRVAAAVADSGWSAPVGYGNGATAGGGGWLNVIA